VRRLTKEDRELDTFNEQRRILRRLWDPETRLVWARGGWFDVIETQGAPRAGKQVKAADVKRLEKAGYITRVPHPSAAWAFELSRAGRGAVDPEGILEQKLTSHRFPAR
jgi:hypothetical protein